jgi:hypothetical protein
VLREIKDVIKEEARQRYKQSIDQQKLVIRWEQTKL